MPASYQSLTIFDTLRRINGNDDNAIYLPALQRHFVWPYAKINKLFDSVMRDYPIGTFLFWDVDEQRAEESSFYRFIQDYSEFGDGNINKPAGRTLPRNILGVLDGQQRLNSMYVALLGSFAYYKGGTGCRKDSRAYYLERHFYLNVFWEPEEESEQKYEFEFLTDEEAAPSKFTTAKCWFMAGDVFHLQTAADVKARWLKFRNQIPDTIIVPPESETKAIATLEKLWQKICKESLITYYLVRNRTLSEALEIFVRMNRGGVELSLRELYFSTIAANWKDGREKIEKLERELNAVPNGFKFEVNSLMLACLVLSGNPVRLKVESFKPANVDRIYQQWSAIYDALHIAVKLVAKWGFSGNSAVSLNAVIGIALIARRGLALDQSDRDLRMFLIRSVICGIYARRAEQTLSIVRDYLATVAPGEPFILSDFMQKARLPSSITLTITAENLDELLMTQIWNDRAYVLLSLLHGHLALHQQAFQKDHIHPKSKFDNLSTLNLGPEREWKWRDHKDRLPNLQLLQDGENNNKRASAFIEWLPRYRPEERAQRVYLEQNDIPDDCSLEFSNFEMFFDRRKEHLRNRLALLLSVTDDRNDYS